jgi:hypothetical protein
VADRVCAVVNMRLDNSVDLLESKYFRSYIYSSFCVNSVLSGHKSRRWRTITSLGLKSGDLNQCLGQSETSQKLSVFTKPLLPPLPESQLK